MISKDISRVLFLYLERKGLQLFSLEPHRGRGVSPKEEEEEIYYLSLSTKCFSKEEAVEIAKTVKFVEE